MWRSFGKHRKVCDQASYQTDPTDLGIEFKVFPAPAWLSPLHPAHTRATPGKQPSFPGFQGRVTPIGRSHILDNPTHSLVSSTCATTAAAPPVCLGPLAHAASSLSWASLALQGQSQPYFHGY